MLNQNEIEIERSPITVEKGYRFWFVVEALCNKYDFTETELDLLHDGIVDWVHSLQWDTYEQGFEAGRKRNMRGKYQL